MGPISELNAMPLLTPTPPIANKAKKRPAARDDRRRTSERRRDRRESSIERRLRERRAAPRLAVELECEEKHEGSRFFRVTCDVSPFGLSTRYGFQHPVGTQLQIGLYLPDQPKNPVQMNAKVVGTFPQNTGIRLAFVRPSREAVRRISDYLKSRR